ncbi:hypothetical protein ACFP65_00060 [Marinilactibacillus sp. GCM10026970]|uniref:hypothetical protein n=1 Tax=Marinilactibacillus sp. GCM10026970 TaxID=3252642 RepID=UPI003610C09B
MNHFIEGSYLTIQELEKTVDTLLTQGYDKKDMTIVASPDTKEGLDTDIPVSVYGDDSEDESMMDKIKDLFSKSDENHTTDADQKLLSDYKTELNNGRLILLVEENENAIHETSNEINTTNPSDAPVVDTVNQGADIVVDEDDHASPNHSITPADHPDIDPTDPAHNAGTSSNPKADTRPDHGNPSQDHISVKPGEASGDSSVEDPNHSSR